MSGLAALLLAGGAGGGDVARAEDAPVAARIDAAFSEIPDNPVDLAIPLAKRALILRFAEGPEPLSLPVIGSPQDTEGTEPGTGSGATPAVSASTAAEIDDGAVTGTSNVDGQVEDAELPRLPRPRPDTPISPLGARDLVAGPGSGLDLIAAPPPVPDLVPNPMVEPATTSTVIRRPGVMPRPVRTARIDVGPTAPVERIAAAASTIDDAPPPPAPMTPAASPPAASPSSPAQVATVEFGPDCLSVDEVSDRDGDFSRNEAVLGGAGFCIGQEKFKERRRPWTIQTVASSRPGPVWAVMHDDEATAFDSAVYALQTYGGVLIALDTGGKRNQDGIDPNRNFSDDEISCAKLGEAAAPKFTAAFRKLVASTAPVIALHNNHDGPVPTGGLGHVTMTYPPKGMERARSQDAEGPLAADNILVLLAATDPDEAAVQQRMETLSRTMNVIVEPVREGQGDCSLSNYVALAGNANYFNLTVDHDRGDEQRQMIDAIMSSVLTIAAAE